MATIVDDDPTASEAEAGPAKRRRDGETAVKIEWTDDDDDEAAYERLKKRRRGTSRTTDKKDYKDKDKNDGGLPAYLPAYLHERRRQFDARRARLGDAGLRLPPDYGGIAFSEDEGEDAGKPGRLETRPSLPHVRPSRPRRDLVLAYSAGVVPGSAAQYLRDYQVEGVQFLHRLFVYQRGGLLGDDMGLGKTVQVAAFLLAAFGKTGDERDAKRMRKMRRAGEDGEEGEKGRDRWYPRVLVVCPGSLLENWRAELQRWGWWHVDVFHGAGKAAVLQAARAGRLEVVLTTYATYKNHRARVNAVAWDAVVADECHVLKERGSATTAALDEVNALCRIGLTGTAIQNRYDELWTLLNWTNPGRFGSASEWRAAVARPLALGQAHDATLLQLSRARRTARQLVHNLLPDVFLRRVKALIAHQLPRKTDRVVFCPLTPRQARAYQRLVDSDAVALLRTVAQPCPCGSGRKRGWCCHRCLPGTDTPWFRFVFPAIQSLLKLANHLMLLVPSADGAVGPGTGGLLTGDPPDALPPGSAAARHARALEVLRICEPAEWAALYQQRDALARLADPGLCGKWAVLRKLLRFWHASGDNNKVLVFSHSVRLLRILQLLFQSTTSYSVSYLDGALRYDERQRVVDAFNRDPAQFVFLLSTRAGGVGLNIASANKVVLFDPHWNPAHDLQAQDRAYRIGQARDVDVFRLVAAGTIEEVVYARQVYKQQQANIGYRASTERRYFRGVQQDSQRQGEIWGLANLLAFDPRPDHLLLRDIVHQTNIAEAKAGVHLAAIDMARAARDRDARLLARVESGGAEDLLAVAEGAADDAPDEVPDEVVDPSHVTNPVQAILASAGVTYTHDNAEVVGSSRVEEQLSRHAERVLGGGGGDAGLLDGGGRSADDTDAGDAGDADGGPAADLVAAAAADQDGIQYNPPSPVRRRQFCTMARAAGCASATAFALVVEGWTPAQRSRWLDGFYRQRAARVEAARVEAARVEAAQAAQAAGLGRAAEAAETVDDTTDDGSVASLVVGDGVVERRVRITGGEGEVDEKEGKEVDEKEKKKDDKVDTVDRVEGKAPIKLEDGDAARPLVVDSDGTDEL